MKRSEFFAVSAAVAAAMILTSCSSTTPLSKSPAGYDPANPLYLLAAPGDRQADPDRYFGHEYQQINARRGATNQSIRPDNLLGLAMSGGGIRSAAFQLGILSGIHSTKYKDRPILEQVDYISSVSGGSWASGAYWGTTNSDDAFFANLDAYAKSGTNARNWQAAARILRHEQRVSIFDVTTQRKERWQDDIKYAYCADGDIDLSKHLSDTRCLKTRGRPYPIFNSTHSFVCREDAKLGSYPFETTPDYVGTIVDSTKSGYSGFFMSLSATNLVWANDKWLWFGDRPGSMLSLALAHSSGVVGGLPFLLQYSMTASRGGAPIPGMRATYNLDDGGKSDNLGLLPLLERGVNTIIVSQMGQDDNLIDLPFSREQARTYLRANLYEKFNPLTVPLVHNESYQCGRKSGAQQGKLILIRPTPRNVREFLHNLERNNRPAFDEFFQEEKSLDEHVFPMTATMRQEYSTILIRSYYLLGKYIAETFLPDALAGKLPDL